jgi:predicted DNA-binding transcriptional regulator AlpA
VKIDPDDLIDPTEVAAIIGLKNPNGVSTYRRRRFPDPPGAFPDPIVQKGKAGCVLWRRQDIESWQRARTERKAPRTE